MAMKESDAAVEVVRRGTSLSPQDWFLLDQWGRQLQEAFDEMPYLVGSVGRAERQYRDVDVRMLAPESWVAEHKIRLRTINTAVSLWGRKVTGLPIDFQFQPAEEFHTYDGERRGALGISTQVAVQELREA